MRQQLDRTRLFISTWYTGAGNLKAVFTRRPKYPFERIKKIYGEELDRLKATKNAANPTHQLTEAQKDFIRIKAKAELNKWYRRRFIQLVAAVITTLFLISLLYHFVLTKLI
jgi:hypothetical protein